MPHDLKVYREAKESAVNAKAAHYRKSDAESREQRFAPSGQPREQLVFDPEQVEARRGREIPEPLGIMHDDRGRLRTSAGIEALDVLVSQQRGGRYNEAMISQTREVLVGADSAAGAKATVPTEEEDSHRGVGSSFPNMLCLRGDERRSLEKISHALRHEYSALTPLGHHIQHLFDSGQPLRHVAAQVVVVPPDVEHPRVP